MDRLKKYVDYLLYSIIFILLTLVLGIILMCFIAGTSAVAYSRDIFEMIILCAVLYAFIEEKDVPLLNRVYVYLKKRILKTTNHNNI